MAPVLLRWGDQVLSSYAFFLALAVSVFIARTAAEARRRGLLLREAALALLVLYSGGLAGARLLFVAENLGRLEDPLRAALSPAAGGFAWYGAFLFALPLGAGLARQFRWPTGVAADASALGLCFLGILARVGCFLGGCCFGKPTELPWGVVFPAGSEPAARWGAGAPIHPTQLYEVAYLVGIAWVAARVSRRGRFPGEAFLTAVLLYSVARFTNELWRANALVEPGGLSPAQCISLALGLMAAVVLWLGRRWASLDSTAERSERRAPGAGRPRRLFSGFRARAWRSARPACP